MLTQESELAFGFDPFGDNRDIQLMRHHDNRRHHRLIVHIGGDIAYKRLVDLELVDRQAFEITQAGITGAEVVQ